VLNGLNLLKTCGLSSCLRAQLASLAYHTPVLTKELLREIVMMLCGAGQLSQDSELFHWGLPLQPTHGSATGVSLSVGWLRPVRIMFQPNRNLAAVKAIASRQGTGLKKAEPLQPMIDHESVNRFAAWCL
jgi:hypothetical protein